MHKHATIIGYVALCIGIGFACGLLPAFIARLYFQYPADIVNTWGNIGASIGLFFSVYYYMYSFYWSNR